LARLQLNSDGRTVASTVGSTRVLFDGIAAPVLYAVSGQTSVVLPFSVGNRSTTQVKIGHQGRQSSGVNLVVAAQARPLITSTAAVDHDDKSRIRRQLGAGLPKRGINLKSIDRLDR